jgi:hypothetical protein
MYPAWRSRFSAERVDYERGEVLEGFYRTFFKKLAQDIKTYQWNIFSIAASQARGFKKGATGWTPAQQYAHRKTMMDLMIVAGTTVVAMLLAGMEGDDDDDKVSPMYAQEMERLYGIKTPEDQIKKSKWFKNSAMLLMLRLRSDLSQYNYTIVPEAYRMVSNPSASLNTAKAWGQFFMQLGEPFAEYDKRSGSHEKGDSKLAAKFEKIVPLYRQWERLQRPEELVKYYNLVNKSVDGKIELEDKAPNNQAGE